MLILDVWQTRCCTWMRQGFIVTNTKRNFTVLELTGM